MKARTLRKGDTGEDVKDLQQKLNKFFAIAGLSIIDVDGIFGGATHDAVVEFQEKTFLKEDGIAGPKTMQALNEAIKANPVEIGQDLPKRLEVHLHDSRSSINSRKGYESRLGRTRFSLELGINAVFLFLVNYLDVQNSLRYLKRIVKGKLHTYCNIYAYDFCSFFWAYLPRVYWTKDAFKRILAGETVEAIYGETVREFNADMLFRWLCNEGVDHHGWVRMNTEEQAQKAVNNGAVGLICADRRTKGKSGHITVILPGELKDGAPRQSQAGTTNRKDFHSSWYLGVQFLDYGFFVNYSPKS